MVRLQPGATMFWHNSNGYGPNIYRGCTLHRFVYPRRVDYLHPGGLLAVSLEKQNYSFCLQFSWAAYCIVISRAVAVLILSDKTDVQNKEPFISDGECCCIPTKQVESDVCKYGFQTKEPQRDTVTVPTFIYPLFV